MMPIDEAVARDQIAQRIHRANQKRLARSTRANAHPLRSAVGLGLISLGTRLVDRSEVEDSGLPRAA